MNPQPNKSTAHVSAFAASFGNNLLYSKHDESNPCSSTNGAASLPAGPASPAHDVSTAFARPGTSTDTDRHRRAIAIAAGSSSSRTSGGKKLGKSVVDAARVVVAMRPARRAFARARGAARAARAGAARQIDARVILERGPSFSAPPRASRARASR